MLDIIEVQRIIVTVQKEDYKFCGSDHEETAFIHIMARINLPLKKADFFYHFSKNDKPPMSSTCYVKMNEFDTRLLAWANDGKEEIIEQVSKLMPICRNRIEKFHEYYKDLAQ